MDAQIPVIPESPLPVFGCRKFGIDSLGDHLCTCTTHSGVKKAHDWVVDQFADLFRTTHKVKTQQVVKSRGQHCGDIELVGYLTNKAHYQTFFWVLIDLIVELLVLIIKPFDNQTES
jgi:hypothetical protein